MALDAVKIKSSAALASLTDEQVNAIAELSTNDENAVIAKKTGEIYGGIDRDIEESTGLKKPEGLKTYEWLKKDVLPVVKSSSTLQTALDAEKQKVVDLQEQVKNGKVDEAIKKQLEDSQALVAQLQTKITDTETDYKSKLTAAEQANLDIRVGNEFDRSLVGKKFKDEKIISKAVRESFIGNAKSAILAENKPDFIDDGQGGKRLVFRGEDGEIKRNPENNLNPFTAEELFIGKISDVLDLGKKQPGGGTKPPGGGGGKGSAFDLSGAKTQVEADDLSTTYLMEKGLTRGSEEFNAEFDKIRTENKVADLPLR